MRWHFFAPHPGFDGPWWWLAHLLGGALGLLFWLALAGLAVWAITRLARRRPPQGTSSAISPLEIVRQRYARGEIDDTTYMQMMERLSATEPSYQTGAASAPLEGSEPPRYSGGPPTFGTDLI